MKSWFLIFFFIRLSNISGLGQGGEDKTVHNEINRLDFLSFLVFFFFFLYSLSILQLKVILICWLAIYCFFFLFGIELLPIFHDYSVGLFGFFFCPSI